MVEWDKIGTFDRYPKLNDLLKEVGTSKKIKFEDNGKLVSADVLQSALKKSGQKGIKARDTEVFIVSDDANKKYELWIGSKSFSVLGQIKKLYEKNENTLIGAKGLIKRVSKDNPDLASFEITAL